MSRLMVAWSILWQHYALSSSIVWEFSPEPCDDLVRWIYLLISHELKGKAGRCKDIYVLRQDTKQLGCTATEDAVVTT